MTDLTANPEQGVSPGVAENGEDLGPTREERERRRRWLLLFLLFVALLILIGLAIWYFLFRQPIPLPPPIQIDLPGYTTSFYGADDPVGIAVSQDGSRIYVAQTGGGRNVMIFDGGGNPVAVAAPPASTGSDHVPVWLAIDPITSELYVSDRPTGKIYVYDRAGGFLREFVLADPISGWQPMGVAFDAAGELYVADLASANARIERFDRSGNLVQVFGEGDRMSFPNGIAVDRDGNVFVADSNNGRLLAYRSDGTFLAQVGRGTATGELALPRGIAVDGQGRIYVCDATGQGVSVFRLVDGPVAELVYSGFFGGEGIADGRFSFPNGVAADGRGRLYVSDTNNDRVQLWSY